MNHMIHHMGNVTPHHESIVYHNLIQLGDEIVLNLGCGSFGTARIAQILAFRRKRLLVAADINVAFLVAARSHFVFGCQTTYIGADATSLGLRRASVGVILALGLFGNLRAMSGPAAWFAVLKESRRVLRKGGLMVISNSAVRQPAADFKEASFEAGFTVDEYFEDTPSATDPRYLLLMR